MFDQNKNPTSLNLEIPKPKTTRINKYALVLIAVVLLFVLIAGLLSLDSKKSDDANQSAPLYEHPVADEEKNWYRSQSNALITHTSEVKSLATTTEIKTSNSTDIQLAKMQAEQYLQAMNAPLAPSGMSTQSGMISAPSEVSVNVDSGLDSTARNLPLNEKQIEKLSHFFGDHPSSEKQALMDTIARKSNPDYLNESLNKPVSLFEVKAGTLIPSNLISGVTSDLPGQIIAQVRQNVYDTVLGKYLLIPQGSKLILRYDNNVAFGQERVLIAVKRIIFPNGYSMNLEGMPASDEEGYAGFKDQVNNHYLKIYGAAIATGGIAALFQMSQPKQSNSVFVNPTNTQIAAGAMGQQLAQTATMTMSKNMNIPPNLEIRQGYEFNIQVTSDLIFPKPYTSE